MKQTRAYRRAASITLTVAYAVTALAVIALWARSDVTTDTWYWYSSLHRTPSALRYETFNVIRSCGGRVAFARVQRGHGLAGTTSGHMSWKSSKIMPDDTAKRVGALGFEVGESATGRAHWVVVPNWFVALAAVVLSARSCLAWCRHSQIETSAGAARGFPLADKRQVAP